jgi:hypothetical protein
MNIRIKCITAVILVLASVSTHAQRRAIEIGVGVGSSINSNPGSNMAYKGNRIAWGNYSGLLNVSYNIHRSMSIGIEARSMELSRKSDNVYPTYLKTTIGGDDRKFVYSKAMMSAAVIFNGRYSLYRGYFYGGGAAGYAASRHDSKNVNNKTESYRAPNGGNGFVLGVQAGYTHGINSVLGLNIEGAVRNYTMNYDALAPEVRPYEKLGYNITAYTLTVGIRFRIMPKYRAENDIPAMRGKGRSRR